MSSSTGRSAGSTFHEWPLVVFTTLAILGAGLLSAPLLAWMMAGTPAPAAGAMPWGAFLLAAGLLMSVAHLGRPLRAPLAPRGFGRSRLSAEIVLGLTAVAVGGVAAALPYTSPALDIASGVAALAFLVTLGLVYNLPGQRAWRGAVVWMPLSSGLGFGAVALAAIWGHALIAVGSVAAVVLGADAGLLILRRAAIAYARPPLTPRYPSLFARRDVLLGARFLLVDVVPGLLVLAGLPAISAGLIAIGVLVDRVAFYGLACQHTTEAEAAHVESLLAQ